MQINEKEFLKQVFSQFTIKITISVNNLQVIKCVPINLSHLCIHIIRGPKSILSVKVIAHNY